MTNSQRRRARKYSGWTRLGGYTAPSAKNMDTRRRYRALRRWANEKG